MTRSSDLPRIATNERTAGPFQSRSQRQILILHGQRNNALPHSSSGTIDANLEWHENKS